jgi:hypothetical protein
MSVHDGIDDLLLVVPATRTVHRWVCDATPVRSVAWSPAMAGLDDEACPACLPDGLPT